MATFAEIITELRGEKKRQEVAYDVGISRASLEYYEKGKRKPDIEILAKFADYFGVSADYLLGRTDVKTVDKDLQFVCDYTGLDEESIENLQEYKNSLMFSHTIEYLLTHKLLLKKLSSYLFSSVYQEYNNSDYYKYLPQKKNYTSFDNPLIAQKVAFSELIEQLPFDKEEATRIFNNDKQFKEKIVFSFAKQSADLNKIKYNLGIIDIGYDKSDFNESYLSEEDINQLNKLQIEYDKEREKIEQTIIDEDIKANDVMNEFMYKLKKAGDINGNNPQT